MDNALKGISNAEAFIDDTIVHSGSFELHLKHLDSVLSGLRVAGIQLRADKPFD